MSSTEATDGPKAYPPTKHLLRDLRLDVTVTGDGTARATMPVVDEIRTDVGTVRLGVLATLVDVLGGALAAVTIAPDWMATSDLAVHLGGISRPAAVEADARVLHRGATTIVIEVDLRDEHHDRIGAGSLGFAVLPRQKINPKLDAAGTSQMTVSHAGSGFALPITEVVGIRLDHTAIAAATMPIDPYVQNSFGALQGGVHALLADVSAQQAVRSATNASVVTCDLQLTYLEMGRVGPFSAATDVHEVAQNHGAARVDITDTGQNDSLISVARVRATVMP